MLLGAGIWIALAANTFLSQFEDAFAAIDEKEIQVDGRWTWEATLLFEAAKTLVIPEMEIGIGRIVSHNKMSCFGFLVSYNVVGYIKERAIMPTWQSITSMKKTAYHFRLRLVPSLLPLRRTS